MKKTFFFCMIIMILFFFIMPWSAVSDSISPPHTVLGVYMVGGDLEYDSALSPEENAIRKESASKDMDEMITGWGSGNPEFDVDIAYGGAEKEGWKGLTITSIQDLIQDSYDGTIGNEKGEEVITEEIDMGSPEGLRSFLTYLKNTYPDSRIILILWDHGSSYLGYGRDENYGGSQISISGLQKALQVSNNQIEILGFDACYMADLEVARAVAPYAQYMIASEESEPDHGWNYESLVSMLVENPDIDAESFAQKVIDSYMDNPRHQKGSLTLSFLDLSKTDDVINKLGTFAQKADEIIQNTNEYPSVSRIVGQLNGIGRSKDEQNRDVEYMVDLTALSEIAAAENPDIREEAGELKKILNSFVRYARQDTPLQQVSGVGIFSPIMTIYPEMQSGLSEGTVLDITPEWISFLSSLKTMIRADTVAPEITASGEGYRVSENGYALVTYVYYLNRQDGTRVVLAQEPASPDESGIFPAPEWNGGGTYLSDGNESVLLPVYYVDSSEEGVQLYYAWGTLQQDSKKSLVRMDIWYDPVITSLQWSINPYIIRDGKQEFDRSAAKMYDGDVLTAYTLILDESSTMKWEKAGEVSWNNNMKITHQMMPCGEYNLQIIASDLNGNTGESEMIPFEISCTENPT